MTPRHDLAARDAAYDLGFDALHGASPDEILMAREEMSLAAASASANGHAPAPLHEDVFVKVTNQVWAGRPGLTAAGYRVWILGLQAACGSLLPVATGKDLRQMRAEALACPAPLRCAPSEEAARVFELLVGQAVDARDLGRRASLLSYALNRSTEIRAALPSFAKIGELWELTAANKRSAVCAAMNKLRAELMRWGRMKPGYRFWFEKAATARPIYREAQRGNTNRRDAEHAHEDEHDDAMAWEEGDKP